jgi:hypothetical protein
LTGGDDRDDQHHGLACGVGGGLHTDTPPLSEQAIISAMPGEWTGYETRKQFHVRKTAALTVTVDEAHDATNHGEMHLSCPTVAA